jgi:hypothetical protein
LRVEGAASAGGPLCHHVGVRWIVIAALALAVAAPSFGSTTRPRVWLADESPVTIAGMGFHARERVTVRLGLPGKLWKKSLVVGPRGGFTTRFPLARLPQCKIWSVHATGAQGSVANERYIPECPAQ